MKPVFRISLVIFLIIVCCIPVTFIVNILLYTFWLWFEKKFGIEAAGHSGPAEWTFTLIYFLFITIFILGYWFIYKNKSAKQI